jgi:hypothetical protein
MGLDLIIEWGIYGSLAESLGTAYITPFFCAFVAFWSQLMLEYWKRTEATKSMEWGNVHRININNLFNYFHNLLGMTEFEEQQQERHGFDGKKMKSFVNGKEMTYFPQAERSKRAFFSYFLISLMILLVIGCVSCIFVINFYISQSEDSTVSTLGSPLSSVLNALQIQVLNYFYGELAVWLTVRENHKTDTDYEDALITKLFAFQFVNSYASFFYVAFIKQPSGSACQYDSCMAELSMSLAIVFGTRLFVGNAQEVLIPAVQSALRARADRGENKATKLTRAEQEFTLETYDTLQGTLDDYAELAIQYGYTTLFVAAFPLAPLMAYISNIVEIRSDGYKLMFFYKRSIPTGVEDIGTWMGIFQVISMASVISNAGLVAFTMEFFSGESNEWRWVYFILFQYLVFFIMAYFSYIVDDVPEEVAIQLERQKFIVDKVLLQIDDESEENLHLSGEEEIIINENDDEPYPDQGLL